jgi:hypothetical protein
VRLHEDPEGILDRIVLLEGSRSAHNFTAFPTAAFLNPQHLYSDLLFILF